MGKLAGLLCGILAGSWFLALFGLVLGHLFEALVRQQRKNRLLASYLEFPDSRFKETVPGSAALSALSALVLRESALGRKEWKTLRSDTSVLPSWAAEFTETTLHTPPSEYISLVECAKMALTRSERINPDLLAESLAARRREVGDGVHIAQELRTLEGSGEAQVLVEKIAEALDPRQVRQKKADNWDVLGLSRGASIQQVKASFRSLAAQFHPDTLGELEPEQAKAAQEAFIRVEKAYRELLSSLRRG